MLISMLHKCTWLQKHHKLFIKLGLQCLTQSAVGDPSSKILTQVFLQFCIILSCSLMALLQVSNSLVHPSWPALSENCTWDDCIITQWWSKLLPIQLQYFLGRIGIKRTKATILSFILLYLLLCYTEISSIEMVMSLTLCSKLYRLQSKQIQCPYLWFKV